LAALAYVRECGRQTRVIDVEEFGQRRWRQDGEAKRRVMIDALVDDVRSGVTVVDVWQRFEVSGSIARMLIGARSYGDLYRILMVNEMPVGYRPGDVAAWVTAGKVSVGDGSRASPNSKPSSPLGRPAKTSAGGIVNTT